jgi:hypothetical protein
VAPVSIGFGIVLIVLGVASFLVTGSAHPTALIPAAFGVLLLVLGGLALKERVRKHAMHGAAMVAAVGFVVPVARLLTNGTTMAPAALIEHLLMATVCLVFEVLCVRSFVVARRSRASKATP